MQAADSKSKNRSIPSAMKDANAVALGRKGGKAGRGAAKARTSEQAQAAAFARWAKAGKKKKKTFENLT
jgi:hypothetical protein